MKLTHYSTDIITLDKLEDRAQVDHHKPVGFWVSDEDCEDNWKTWCEEENFSPDRLKYCHDVELIDKHNVLIIDNERDLDGFTYKYNYQIYDNARLTYIDWDKVRLLYSGVIITPYQWNRRMTFHTFWYYGWDCASGCIWDNSAIKSITLREI